MRFVSGFALGALVGVSAAVGWLAFGARRSS